MVDWAARAQLVKQDGGWKFVLYEVYLVCSFAYSIEPHSYGMIQR